MADDDLVRVLTTTSVPEGEIARSLLEDEGIPVLLKGEAEGPYRMGPVHLYVPAGLEVQARLILAASQEPAGLDDGDEDASAEDDELEDALDEERGGPGS